ncbi:2-oxoacid:ferredoxin oxidoreductase subunit beta [Limisalsivibrio acetivorans]|uniref:2-oxoacid:ferredoxin oxidoreductase subunit beta n=1 Tax=Limisalsivibrio acetivorans TaxID=1304888 RepID=UPI0003B5D830|nr:2-oxoacid:ferredoxin oxidoreductase subunit beta [Limisalsivibrio acetivorans]
MAFDYSAYLRDGKIPHIWCPGCGYGIILKSFIRAIDKLGWNKNEIVVTSGIGCASRLPGYVDFNTLHTTHGRSLGFATGVKLANPNLKVIGLGGDGDMTAIGGNHFIHACRRNIDITCLVFNNYIYGMTGGQYSPTTPKNAKATTVPYGNADNQFDISSLAIGAGATFVARTTTYHAVPMEKLIMQALQHKGFSVVEIMAGCPTGYGRKNKQGSPANMIQWQKDMSVPVAKAKDMTPEEMGDKFAVGVLHQEEKTEYVEAYDAQVGLS